MPTPMFEQLESRIVLSAFITGATLAFVGPPAIAQPAARAASQSSTRPATTHPSATLPAATQRAEPMLRAVDLSGVKSFVYQLQNIDLNAIAKTKFDLAVIDYSEDGSDEQRFSAKQIRHVREGAGGGDRKTVLAYMSIGEAEDYRWYWKKEWDAKNDGKPDRAAPKWLGPVDPDWPGNYKVKYWDPAWQGIVKQYLDRVIDAGFDGVYLDIIDAYEFWGPGGASGLGRKTAEAEMVDFVKSIAAYARETKGVKHFLVFVQNAEELASHKDYLDTVSGIGKEDTWYDGNTANKPADIADTLANLDLFKKSGKLVLTIDYVTRTRTINDFYAKSTAKGYIPYASTRDLDRLTINKGHEPK